MLGHYMTRLNVSQIQLVKNFTGQAPVESCHSAGWPSEIQQGKQRTHSWKLKAERLSL